jgi:serine/threonine protein kinase
MFPGMDIRSESTGSSDKRRFYIHNCLGSGGFGEVYLATMISSGGVQTEVAVKVLHTNLDAKSQAIQRLRDEGKLLGILNHPAILRVTDLVLLEGRIALVTEYVEGADLDDCFKADPPLSLRATIQVIGQIADALNAAYHTKADGEALRLVHRDVKPANIRLGKHGDVKLLDFGIARTDTIDREAKTQTNTVIGSFAYMAPERFERHETVEPQGDVYSLGCVLYEHITKSYFYDAIPLREQYLYALNSLKYLEYMEGKLDAARGAPQEVQALLRRLLSYDPAIRPTPAELVRLCEDLADNLTGTPLRRWSRDRDWPPPPKSEAPFSGRVITESTLTSLESVANIQSSGLQHALTDITGVTLATEFDSTSASVELDELPATSRWLIGGAFATGVVIVFLVVLGAGGVGIYFTTRDAPQEIVNSSQTITHRYETELSEAPTPEPVETTSAPEPVETTPAPAPKLREAPPTPKQRPITLAAAPAPTTSASWAVKGTTQVELRADDDRFEPGNTPPGSYTIWAKFPGGWAQAGKIRLDPGASVTLECSALRYQCTETP